MNILITGASGLVGSGLVQHLFSKGHDIFSLQRNKNNNSSFWNFDRLTDQKNALAFDAVIHLAGENIASGRWTKRKKSLILKSRINGTRELADYICKLEHKPELFICASAIGYYGDRGESILDESSPNGSNFVAEVSREWETASKIA